MREKRPYMVMTFRTTTEAMAMEKTCNAQQIRGRLIPVPREITAGCGLSWRMLTEDYKLFLPRLQELGLTYDKVFELML